MILDVRWLVMQHWIWFDVLPCISFSVVELEPYEVELASKLPSICAGLALPNEVPLGPLWEVYTYQTTLFTKPPSTHRPEL